MKKTRVAIIKTKPETVLDDYRRLSKLAGMGEVLNKTATTILKDNISWHLPMPGANSTPWQLEGAVLALKEEGFGEIVAVEN
ncbi:MAG: DUF362 domain-containing protein, partial [Kosmotogaceae bacterium]|nr:DUF362 domain-containing protein [Kosmotogaceae bacterium]